ncbi:hemerythrin domain-containing protein [Sporohalobacter salinus]|uniref:hemerythrin domain-containing protein n=1 Tax=Sporohalobacter salinus TaxID=1494606 RepID=UPI00195F9E14|nr:hemerythrin domain-containing protein [Sporohalobacter salinus]MBM7624740.1 hemerythrin-like domain-containing protein [Sporohalobacter salinus]
MEPIELLKEEHKNIKKVLVVIRKLCIKVFNTGNVDYKAFTDVIDFVRNYADEHHHGKEEDILFDMISKSLDDDLEKNPVEAMFSEHDLGRYFINNLETALDKVKDGEENARIDVIANSIAYADLLDGHIYKEDNIIYSYGQEKLSSKDLTELEERAIEVETNAQEKGIQEKYLNLINELKSKVENINL